MAIVQLDYHPAFKDALSDPLFALEGHGTSLLPQGKDAAPLPLQDRFKKLRNRVKEQYIEQLWLRVEAIVQWCVARDVQVLVFPEYAIPAELLERLAKAAGDCVVVAGSHFVKRAHINQKVYERLGSKQHKDLVGKSVSPVLHQGKLLHLVSKLHPAEGELGQIDPGEDWSPVSLPGAIPGPMAVLICLDYLTRQSERHQVLVAPSYEDCRFVAAPALSKTHLRDDPFRAKALEDTRGYRRPVLFANIAQWGQSTIFVPDKKPMDNRRFPEQAGLLEAGEEGVIVADLNVGMERAGQSTVYEQALPLKPVAAASLVYRGIQRDDARWLDGLRAAMKGDEYEIWSKVEDYVRQNRPPMPNGDRDSARKRKLLRLTQDIEDAPNLEWVRQLTDEIELNQKILPLRVLRAALAEGASREIAHWVRELSGGGEFGPVRDQLHEAWTRLERERAGYDAETQKAAEAVARAVAGENWNDPSQRMLQVVQVLEREVVQGFEEDRQKAGELFEQGLFAEARDLYQRMQERAEMLIREMAPPADSTHLRHWVAVCKCNVAAALLNLQEFEEGRALLLEIEPGDLRPAGRAGLSDLLASVGEEERALRILPPREDMPDDKARRRYDEILQAFKIRAGDVPEQLIDTPRLHLMAAHALLQRNDLSGAADHALWVLEADKGDALTRAEAAMVLLMALQRTIFESPPDALRIARERRALVLDALEGAFESLSQRILPEETRKYLAQGENAFKDLVSESDASQGIVGQQAFLLTAGMPLDDKRGLAFRLARDGRLDEALDLMPVEGHPWGDRLNRAVLRMMAGSPERPMSFGQALDELRALAKEFPNRAMIEANLSGLTMHEGHPEEALVHARNAFEELPCLKYRARLAKLELGLGNAERAWDLLKDCKLESRPTLLGLYAHTAEQTGRLSEAERAIRRYIELKPGDGVARMGLARLLHDHLHRLDEAADTAWALFQEQGNRLELDDLYACGTFQRRESPLNDEQSRRIKAVAAKLKERYPMNARAESIRLGLLSLLGEWPKDMPPVDFPLLVKEGLAYQGSGLDSLREHIQQQRQWADIVDKLRRQGLLPALSACSLLGCEAALALTRILNITDRTPGHLCAPVSLEDKPPFAEWTGLKILVSELELLLLDALDLVPILREALGSDGRLLIFGHVWARIVKDADGLRSQARPDKLQAMESLLRRLEGVPVLDAKPTEAPSGKALLRYLDEEHLLDAEALAELEPCVSAEEEPSEAQRQSLSEGVVLHRFWVEEFEKNGRLSAILDALRGKIRLGPDVIPWLKGQRNELADILQAYARADRLHAYLGEGWIQKIPAPRVDELPPLRDPEARTERLLLDPPKELLSYRRAMREQPDLWRLNAEFYGSLGISYLGEVLPWLSWKDGDQVQTINQMMLEGAARDITFPMLVRHLVRDRRRANEVLIKLAELGFPDALGASEILYLEQRYRGVNKGEPKRILDRMEWMAREPSHQGGFPARLGLVRVYADTIGKSFLDSDWMPLDRTGLLETLLQRMEALGEASQSDVLDTMIGMILSKILARWELFWSRDGGELRPNWDSPVGRLWSELSRWCGENVGRSAAKGRAFRAFWCMPFGEGDDSHALLGMGMDALHPTTIRQPEGTAEEEAEEEISFLGPENETLAILSALWPESSHRRYKAHLLLQSGIRDLFREGGLRQVGVRETQYHVKFSDKPKPNLVRTPPEALLLRALPEDRPRFARFLKEIQGPYDGIAYGFLEQIEQHPSDAELLRDYARYAANALFRLVQDDPGYLRAWAHSHAVIHRGRHDLETLYQILSEPLEPLPKDQSILQIIGHRCFEGAWHGRKDVARLGRAAAEVPGNIPLAVIMGLNRQVPPTVEVLEEALYHIDQSDDTSTGGIVFDMYLLRITAMYFPNLKLTQGEVNLNELLPARFSRLLDSVDDPPKPDTMAAHEPALLRVCADVIQRLAGTRLLPQRDGIWITFRLFQWLCLQLHSISADARMAGIKKLTQNAPPPAAYPLQDRLDPRGFGREHFDIRLAAVLHALGTMEHAAAVHQAREKSSSTSQNLQSISSPKLEDRLLELAQRFAPPSTLKSALDWDAPDNIPDLALRALLALNIRRFADLRPESRTRRFERLPEDPQHLDESLSTFTAHIILAAALSAGALLPDERLLLENKVRTMAEGPASRQWRLWIYVALYAAGSAHLEADALSSILHHIDDAAAAEWVGIYLLMLAKRAPDRVEPILQILINEAQGRSVDAVPIITAALSRLRVQGEAAEKKIAAELLLDLANRPPFQDDPRMSEVLGFFGLRRRNS